MSAIALRRSLYFIKYKSYSLHSYKKTSTLPLGQGGTVSIMSDLEETLELNITSKWQDTCQIKNKNDNDIFIHVDDSIDSELYINLTKSDNANNQGRVHAVDITIPEHCNINIKAVNLLLNTFNKIMGSVIVQCEQSGFAVIDKIKGSNLVFEAKKGDLVVKKVLEGNSYIVCDNLNAKMINGDNVTIVTNKNSNIEAMYSNNAQIKCRDQLTVSLLKGDLQAKVENGPVKIAGLDGSINIISEAGDIDVQINSLRNESSSSIISQGGKIECILDPELVADVSCSSLENVNLTSDAFERSTDSSKLVTGKFTGKSIISSKRPTFRGGPKYSGKIDLNGAELNWLKSRTVENKECVTSSDSDPQKYSSVLVVEAAKQVNLTTLSWIEIIRRKHGFSS